MRYAPIFALVVACAACDGAQGEDGVADAAVSAGPADAEPRVPVAGRPAPRDAGSAPGRTGGPNVTPRPSSAAESDPGRGEDAGIGDEDAGPADAWPSTLRYEGGDGSSCETAIIILGAQSHFGGIGAEYAWLATHYPGYTLLMQALGMCGEHYADIMSIRTAAGMELDVYFDIEDFFDK